MTDKNCKLLISQQQINIIETIIKPPAENFFFFFIAKKVTELTAQNIKSKEIYKLN